MRPIWEEFALYTDCDLDGQIRTGPYEVFTINGGRGRLGTARKMILLRMWDHLPDGPPSRELEWRADVDVYFGGDLGTSSRRFSAWRQGDVSGRADRFARDSLSLVSISPGARVGDDARRAHARGAAPCADDSGDRG